MRATVITDASHCSRTKAGGWAAWIAYDGGNKGRHAGAFRERPQDSGIAELQAVFNGLWIAYNAGARDILVQTDCMSVVHAIKGMGPYAELYRAARREYFPDAAIRSRHVKGHSGIQDSRSYCNRWCDAEAKRHMRKQRDEL
jgi:ribonuclease HI